MSEDYGFYRSVGGDRRQGHDFLADFIMSLVTDGILDGNHLAVTAPGDTMTIRVGLGKAWNHGHLYRIIGAPETRSIQIADGNLSRYDMVSIRHSETTRDCLLTVTTGTPAVNPEKPVPVRTAQEYDLVLAYIRLPPGAISVRQEYIEDVRLDPELCGIAAGVLQQVDTSQLLLQLNAWLEEYISENETWSEQYKARSDQWLSNFQSGTAAEFAEWFEHIKGQLDEDAAGHLQLEVDAATSHRYTLNVPASGWAENDDGSYSQTFAVPGITAATEVGTGLYALVDSEITADEWQELCGAVGSIGRIRTDEGSVTLTCYNGAPEVDIQNLVLTEVK